ncbi:SRSF protein kinase 3 isoform X1 [Schistocerca nitens]|uniref:SRSF protein kinase 3 isoform X1 n=1 Tax=Schistocerca nitens TaxID=7011 RepID=UPI0021194DFE|nr:SRSF protein kinase 3 isoform X1 [Schistocerca nitens]
MQCDAERAAQLRYWLRAEWLATDGEVRVNNSVRVEWWPDTGDSRAVCEVEEPASKQSTAEWTWNSFAGLCLLITLVLLLSHVVVRRLRAVPFRAASSRATATLETAQPERAVVSHSRSTKRRRYASAPARLQWSEPRSPLTTDVSVGPDEILGSDDDEQEDPKDYCKGGYHPVKIGDLFHVRYHVVRKLGWGHFSTVWLCWDLATKRFVALKVVKSAAHYTDTALDEIKLLKAVRETDVNDPKRDKTVQLLDDFKIHGVNGTHICMVFEVLGHNLLKLIIRSNYQGIPLQNVKTIIRQVLEGLDYLHVKCKIIHTDIKPENVLLCVDESYIRKLAAEATQWHKMGLKLPGSLVSAAPKEFQAQSPNTAVKISKNKRKKMKKKARRQAELEREIEKYELIENKSVDKSAGYVELEGDSNGHSANECEEELTAIQETSVDDVVTSLSQLTLEDRISPARSNIMIVEDCAILDPRRAVVTEVPCPEPQVKQPSYPEEPSNLTAEKPVEGCADQKTNFESNKIDPNEKSEVPHVEVSPEVETETRSVCNGHNTESQDSENGKKKPTLRWNRNSGSSDESDTRQEKEEDKAFRRVASCPDTKNLARTPDPVHEVCDIKVKIADLGNACWCYHHFTEDIQTRQYRCLEVLLGAGYGTPADIWSTACMAFELATGDYLFEPHSGDDYTRDEDHLAHIIELLGPIPRRIIFSGKHSREFFSRKGELRRITKLKPWGLVEVLTEKYSWDHKKAKAFADFLTPMLAYDPLERATASDCLQHPWLNS